MGLKEKFNFFLKNVGKGSSVNEQVLSQVKTAKSDKETYQSLIQTNRELEKKHREAAEAAESAHKEAENVIAKQQMALRNCQYASFVVIEEIERLQEQNEQQQLVVNRRRSALKKESPTFKSKEIEVLLKKDEEAAKALRVITDNNTEITRIVMGSRGINKLYKNLSSLSKLQESLYGVKLNKDALAGEGVLYNGSEIKSRKEVFTLEVCMKFFAKGKNNLVEAFELNNAIIAEAHNETTANNVIADQEAADRSNIITDTLNEALSDLQLTSNNGNNEVIKEEDVPSMSSEQMDRYKTLSLVNPFTLSKAEMKELSQLEMLYLAVNADKHFVTNESTATTGNADETEFNIGDADETEFNIRDADEAEFNIGDADETQFNADNIGETYAAEDKESNQDDLVVYLHGDIIGFNSGKDGVVHDGKGNIIGRLDGKDIYINGENKGKVSFTEIPPVPDDVYTGEEEIEYYDDNEPEYYVESGDNEPEYVDESDLYYNDEELEQENKFINNNVAQKDPYAGVDPLTIPIAERLKMYKTRMENGEVKKPVVPETDSVNEQRGKEEDGARKK